MSEIQVSIMCLVYNHEKYLRKCLDGFVMQQGVTFEIVIHDDASTDNSADIIREYEKKYPNIFKPVYQTENQGSKGVDIFTDFLIPNSAGKYMAICEGDDYWTDPRKLKKQYDALEANPQCSFCTHSVRVISESGKELNRSIPAIDIPEGFISRDDFFSEIWIKSTVPFQTSSYFIRASVCRELCSDPPEFTLVSDVSDNPTVLYFTFRGGVYFIGEKMSCYRRRSIGSWNQRMQNAPATERIAHINSMIKMLSLFSEYTQHTVDVSRAVNRYSLSIFILENNNTAAWRLLQKDKTIYSSKSRIVVFANAFVPWAYPIYRKIKDRLMRK